MESHIAYISPMPIYEFHCKECGKESEILVRSTNWEGTQCPHCGSKKLAKKLSVFASTATSGGSEGACCSTSSGGSCGCCCGGHGH